MVMMYGKGPEKKALVNAAVESLKLYHYDLVNLSYKKSKGLDTTRETLFSDYFKTGWTYIIQNISCWEGGSGTPKIKTGLYDGNDKFPYEIATVGNAEDTVAYVGQLILPEGFRIYADFENAAANDTIEMYINGYRIKK